MKIEIERIANGYVVIEDGLFDHKVFFKTLGHAVGHAKKILNNWKREI